MTRILLTISMLATGGGVALSAQAQPPQAEPGKSAPQSITINGCVYRATNAPGTFAFERTPDADTTGTQPSLAKPAEQANVRGAQGTTGTTTLSPGGAAGTGTTGPAPAVWYRLTSGPAAGFEEFVGRAVRIRGSVTPSGAGDKGATSADVATAPQLVVQDITAVEGQCRTSSAAPKP